MEAKVFQINCVFRDKSNDVFLYRNENGRFESINCVQAYKTEEDSEIIICNGSNLRNDPCQQMRRRWTKKSD